MCDCDNFPIRSDLNYLDYLLLNDEFLWFGVLIDTLIGTLTLLTLDRYTHSLYSCFMCCHSAVL